MKLPAEAPPYLDQPEHMTTAGLVREIEVDEARQTFRLPLTLAPGENTSFAVAGFQSATGVPAAPINLQFKASDADFSSDDRAKFEAAAKDPALLKALGSMKQRRAALTSIAERTQTLLLTCEEGRFTGLKAESSTFKWQKPNLYYADVSDMMMSCSAFKIGSDGQNWWHLLQSQDATEFVACPTQDVRHVIASLCDPFGLARKTPEQAAAKMSLRYLGATELGGVRCRLVENWGVELIPHVTSIGTLTRWWIEEQTGRPLEITQFFNDCLMRTRFLYDKVNEPLPPEDFAIPKLNGLTAVAPEALDKDYTNRLVILRDGSGGQISLRWGKEGPKGRSSDGLN